MPYYYVDIPGTQYKKVVMGWESATAIANALARNTGRVAHIHLSDRYGKKGALKLWIAPRLRRGAAYMAPKLRLNGMGGALTSWACDSDAAAEDWRVRLGSVMTTGATAAVIGAGTAGLIGGLLRRPILGAFVGAATGWAAHAIWTAPLFPGD